MIAFLSGLSVMGVLSALLAVMVIGPAVEWIIRRKLFPSWFRSDESVSNYISLLSLLYGLLLGLAAIALWQKQDLAEMNTVDEASQIRIVLALSGYLPGDTQTLSDALGDYTQCVIRKEWPVMLSGKTERLFLANPELDLVRDTLMDLQPKTPAEQAAFQQAVVSYTQIVSDRHKRLLDSERSVPVILWLTLAVGAIFIWISTWFIHSEHVRSQRILSSLATGYLFVLFYLIVVVEHPFIGAWRVEATPYVRVLEMFH